MKAITSKDLVIGRLSGIGAGVTIPETLMDVPLNKLRFNGTAVVDGSKFGNGTYFIDDDGVKHIIQHNDEWEEIRVDFDATVIKDEDGWRETVPADSDNDIIEVYSDEMDKHLDDLYTSSPSRSARYERKLAQANVYIAAGYPKKLTASTGLYLSGEAKARKISVRQLADRIVKQSAELYGLGALAETARAELAVAVKAEKTIAGKHKVGRAITDSIVKK